MAGAALELEKRRFACLHVAFGETEAARDLSGAAQADCESKKHATEIDSRCIAHLS
jgi:hypothetical protein